MSADAIRVRYAEGQTIRAAELRSEQEYLIALERRHNLAQHAPGIVRGLDFDAPDRVIRPGVAVDDEGRVLALLDDLRIDAVTECVDFWLIRCDSSSRGRIRERTRIAALPVTPTSEAAPPIEGAIYLGRHCNQRDFPTNYTSLRASAIVDPARRAVMQVGPAHGRDRNGFLVSTIDEEGALQPRIAVDRFDANRIDGTVLIAGYRATAALSLGGETIRIYARQPGESGENIAVAVRAEGTRMLRVSLPDGASFVLDGNKPEQRQEAVKNFDSDLVEVVLHKAGNRRPNRLGTLTTRLGFAKKNLIEQLPVDLQLPPDPYTRNADLTLRRLGADLDLYTRFKDVPSPVRLSFIAMPEPRKITPARGIWSVQTGTKAEPSEELRLDLGASDPNDATVRFFLGRVRKYGAEHVLERELAIFGNAFVSAPAMRVVRGSIRVAPIKADYTDINFVALLLRAYMDGLAAAVEATNEIALEFVGLPDIIRRGRAWSYKVKLTNSAGREIVAARLLETLVVTGAPAPFSQPLTPQAAVPNGQSQEIATVDHQPNAIPAGRLGIAVRVTGSKGSVQWWKELRTASNALIPVVESPHIDVTGIPASVPAGQPFAVSFSIENRADRSVKVPQLVLRRDATQLQVWANLNLGPKESRTFSLAAPHPPIVNPVVFHVESKFEWTAATIDDEAQLKNTIVADDLDTNIVVTAPIDPIDWSSVVELTNVAGQRVTVNSVRRRVFDETNALLYDDVLVIEPRVIEAADEASLEIEGEDVGNATAIRIVVTIGYTRKDGQAFTIDVERGGIQVQP